MSNTEVREFNLDILDVALDDIEDLPSYDCPPNGTYQLLLNTSTQVFAGKDGKPDTDAVKFEYEIAEVVEVAGGQTDLPVPKTGDKFTELFGLASEDGIKYLKKSLLVYAQHFSTTNLKELITEKLQNIVIVATVKGRKAGKKAEDPDKRYPQVSNVNIV